MSRDLYYQRLLNSKEWKMLRHWKLQQNQLCEMCQREGKVTSAYDIHHIIPVETATTRDEMEALCFNPNNLMAVCIPCHIAIHTQMQSHTKDAHKEREEQRLNRWIERHKRHDPSDDPDNKGL